MNANLPEVTIIEFEPNKFLYIDSNDLLIYKNHTWSHITGNYGHVYFTCGKDYLHRKIMGLVPFDKILVDHKNGDGLDFRKNNLRLSNYTNNSRNAKKVCFQTHSIYKGVYKFKKNKSNPWKAQIRINKKTRLHLGYFSDEIEAAKSYDEAARKYHGEFACVNFPKTGERGALI